MEILSEELVTFTGRVGKPANDILYTHVKYNGKEYTVMEIEHDDTVKYIIMPSPKERA